MAKHTMYGSSVDQTKKRLIVVATTIAGIILVSLAIIIGISLNPTRALERMSATELLDLGEKYLLEMKYEQATVIFNKLIKVEPMNPRGYTGLAEANIELGDIDQAIEVLQKGMERLPDNPTIIAMFDRLIAEQIEAGNTNNLPTRSSPSTSMTTAPDEVGTKEMYVLIGEDQGRYQNGQFESEDYREYIYNDKGQRIRTNYYMYDHHGEVTNDWSEYEYDDAGKLIRSTIHYFMYDDAFTNVLTPYSATTEYEYDDLDRVVNKNVRYLKSGTTDNWLDRETIYEYDASGNLVKETITEGELHRITKYVYEDRRLIREDTSRTDYNSYNEIIELIWRSDYEYDDQGRIIKEVKLSDNSQRITIYRYSYDESGNLIRIVPYYEDGNIDWSTFGTEYRYDLIEVDDNVTPFNDEWYTPWAWGGNGNW